MVEIGVQPTITRSIVFVKLVTMADIGSLRKTTVHIVGRGSYLAGVLAKHLAKEFAVNRLSANQIDDAVIRASDVVINCSFPPALLTDRVAGDLGIDGSTTTVWCLCYCPNHFNSS